ncbi:MAG: T9SS type A sorting domain-containing protein [Bacteroidia bacterium]
MNALLKPILWIVFLVTALSGPAGLIAQQLDWAFAIQSGDFSSIEDLALDEEGNLYFIGESWDTLRYELAGTTYVQNIVGNTDAYFGKVSPTGRLLWLHNLGSRGFEYGNSIAYDPAGYIYITGMFEDSMDCDFGPGNAFIVPQNDLAGYLIKYDTTGLYQWNYVFDGSGTDIGLHVAVDNRANVIVSGEFDGIVDFDPGAGVSSLDGDDGRIFIVKLDSAGLFRWAGQLDVFLADLQVDRFSQIYLTGGFFSGNTDLDPGPGTRFYFNNTGRDGFFIKLDEQGNLLTVKTISGNGSAYPARIAIDSAGSVYWAGGFSQGVFFDSIFVSSTVTGRSDIFLMKYDSAGFFQWYKTYNGISYKWVNGFALDQFGSMYISGVIYGDVDLNPGNGSFRPNQNNPDGRGQFLSKLDNQGNLKWNHYIELDSTKSFSFNQIEIDNQNRLKTIGKVWQGLVDLDPDTATSQLFYEADLVLQQFSQCFIDSVIADSGCISYRYRGETFGQSGQYKRLYTDFQPNCDARIRLDISIFPEYSGINDTAVVCPGASFVLPNGVVFNNVQSPFSAAVTLVSQAGCDSIVDYQINLAPDHNDFQSFDLCYGSSYTFPDGTLLSNITNDTSYLSQLLTSSNSCDSNITTLLNVIDVDNDLLVNGNTLIAAASNASYQWLNCSNGYAPIAGATDSIFVVFNNGSYAVEVSQQGCRDTSVCYTVLTVANEELAKNGLRLYPNPAENGCWVEANAVMPELRARIFDLRGRLLLERKAFNSKKLTLDLRSLGAGVYVVELSDGISRQSLRLMHH